MHNAGYNPKPISFGTKVPQSTPAPELNQADSCRMKGKGSGEHEGTVDNKPYESVPNPVANVPKSPNVTNNPTLR